MPIKWREDCVKRDRERVGNNSKRWKELETVDRERSERKVRKEQTKKI